MIALTELQAERSYGA